MTDKIIIKGAREHNLKNINIEIPRGELVVITGLSGSGKSSLAFDTIYAEGQRRYVESLSAYARQFLGQMDKPDVDSIEGLSPAISIDQKTTSRNPRSTVGTVTEIYDYLRLLFARAGRPHCPNCKHPIEQQTVQQMVDQVMALPEGSKIEVLSPLIRGRKGEYQKLFADTKKDGFLRVRVDGEMKHLEDDEINLSKNKKHTIEVVVDRLIIKEGLEKRLADSLEAALKPSGGLVAILVHGKEEELFFSENFACIDCGFSFEEMSPRMFSFNSPYGACDTCSGLGFQAEVDSALVVPNSALTLGEGAVFPWNRGNGNGFYQQLLMTTAAYYKINTEVPFSELSKDEQEIVLYGNNGEVLSFTYIDMYGKKHGFSRSFEGVVPNLTRRLRETTSEHVRTEISEYMTQRVCPICEGNRLNPASLSVFVGDKNISEVTAFSVTDALDFFQNLNLTEKEAFIARLILKEIDARLGFLRDVGLNYLSLDRPAGTLSGGEAQRIRLATQIGAGLTGVLYILDEPSIGLHQRDNQRLLKTLKNLRDLGNTVIVVEHDEETIREADFIIDIGPGAGAAGGEVVATGGVEAIMSCPASITGQYLKREKVIAIPSKRRKPNGKEIVIKGARGHNLKSIDATFPLGVFICVTGVSGSGKSTLVNEILYKSLAQRLHKNRNRPLEFDEIKGLENLDKVIEVDQSPIGRTPRSNPATYTGVFDGIREIFSGTRESKARGYRPGRFSFNVKGGRCEACRGDGIIKIEMHFLPDVYVPCEVCKGKRYNRETLEVKYKDKNIADVLNMTVEEALEFFAAIPKVNRRLQTIYDVGLGYIKLGQPATTLSGGEAQRIKLATELSRRSNGRTLYILDEPTTGLHIDDIRKLLIVLDRLTDVGDTVLVIEHNLDVIKRADYILDLGPEGGEGGGQVLAKGTPEEVAKVKESYTGKYLAPILTPEVNSQ